jgi:hypothetical protein
MMYLWARPAFAFGCVGASWIVIGQHCGWVGRLLAFVPQLCIWWTFLRIRLMMKILWHVADRSVDG